VTREEFLQAMDILDTQAILTERQKAFLVTFADKNKNNQIEYDEFLDVVKHVDPEDQQNLNKGFQGGIFSKLIPGGLSNMPEAKIKSLADFLGDIDQDKTEEEFAKYMDKIQLSPEDYFREGCKTILNNQLAALKK